MTCVEPEAIEAARARIAPLIDQTPILPSPTLERRLGLPVYLKCEHRQITGAFKLRGAANAMLGLSDEQRANGVVTASTGNHGRALAYAARQTDLHATICMSRLVPTNKVRAVQSLGASVEIVGDSQDEAMRRVEELVGDGMTCIPPFDHPDVIAGQGTIGLEILGALPDVDTILVQLSGGGLISGIALAVKALRPATRIIGISMERGAVMKASLDAGHPVELREQETLADSLGGGIGLQNRYTFAMVRDLVDDVILLNEDEIARGIAHAYWHEGENIEGAGGVGIGAILAGKIRANGPVVVLLSGANIDRMQHFGIIAQYKPD